MDPERRRSAAGVRESPERAGAADADDPGEAAGGRTAPGEQPGSALDPSMVRLLDALPVLGWVKDARGRYAHANAAWCETFHQPANGWAGRTDDTLGLTGSEVEALRGNDRRVLRTGEPVAALEWATTRSRTERPFLVIKFPVDLPARGEAEPAVGVAGVAVGVADAFTEQHQLALALQAAGGGSWAWEIADGRVELSDACWAMIGLEPGSLPPRISAWLDRAHPADTGRLTAAIERCHRREADAYREVVRLRTGEGGWRHVLTSGRVRGRGTDGRVLRFVGILLDVEQIKRLESELQRRNDELASRVSRGLRDLEESEERFLRLAEEASLMLWTHGTAGCPDGEPGAEADAGRGEPLWLNQALEAFLGPAGDSAAGGRRVIHERVAQLAERVRGGGDTPSAGDGDEAEVVDALGRRRWILVLGQPRRTGDGRVLGFVGTVEDVTERREAREALRRSHEELESLVASRTAELHERLADLAERNRELDRFTHIASHDLRSPLRTVLGFASHLEREVGGDPAMVSHVRRIQRAGQRMSDLLDSLLDFASVGRGRMVAAPVSLDAVVRLVLEDLPPHPVHGAACVCVGPLPEVEGDAVMLRQAFGNLLSNAVKYAGDRPPRVEVVAEAVPAGGLGGDESKSGPARVRVLVKDGGLGFDPAEANRLFEPFERGADPRIPGSGVGLSIVKRVVERHDGRVWARVTPGEPLPTRFVMELPVRRAAPAASEAEVPGVFRG